MSRTPVDVVEVAFRSQDVIERSVQAALGLGGRVVVVDHGDGRSAALAAAAGATTIVDPSNPGFGSGQNRGVRQCESEFVLLCNPDAEIDAAAVQAGVAHLRARPDIAAIQGVIVNRSTGKPERSQGVELTPLHLLGRAVGARRLLDRAWVRALARRSPLLRDHAERVPAGPVEVETLVATALLVRREAFDWVGGFDPMYFLYGEDLDLCRRWRRAGWKLLAVPEIWATHISGGSAISSSKRERDWWEGTLAFAATWWSGPKWWAARAAAAVHFALRDGPGTSAGPSPTAAPAVTRRRRVGAVPVEAERRRA